MRQNVVENWKPTCVSHHESVTKNIKQKVDKLIMSAAEQQGSIQKLDFDVNRDTFNKASCTINNFSVKDRLPSSTT